MSEVQDDIDCRNDDRGLADTHAPMCLLIHSISTYPLPFSAHLHIKLEKYSAADFVTWVLFRFWDGWTWSGWNAQSQFDSVRFSSSM